MTHESELVAVTGGSGFIGTHLIQSLLAQNTRVRVLARDPNRIQLSHPKLEVIAGALGNISSLYSLVENASKVIHCAGRVRGINQNQFDTDNVVGTQNLINACLHCDSIEKLIFISSLAAREPDISHYSKSKHTAEQVIKNVTSFKWMVIRPPAVYGPGDRELLPLFNWMKKGILWIPANPEQKFSLIHIFDLVNLIIKQLSSATRSETLEPNDGCCYDWDLISHLCSQFFGREVRKIVVPEAALLSAAYINVLLSRLVNYSPMLTPSKTRELMHRDWQAKGVEDSYNWSAQIDLNKGLSTLYSSK